MPPSCSRIQLDWRTSWHDSGGGVAGTTEHTFDYNQQWCWEWHRLETLNTRQISYFCILYKNLKLSASLVFGQRLSDRWGAVWQQYTQERSTIKQLQWVLTLRQQETASGDMREVKRQGSKTASAMVVAGVPETWEVDGEVKGRK